jgi:hypothetical protein
MSLVKARVQQTSLSTITYNLLRQGCERVVTVSQVECHPLETKGEGLPDAVQYVLDMRLLASTTALAPETL